MTGLLAIVLYLLVCGLIITIQMIRDLQKDLRKTKIKLQDMHVTICQIYKQTEK